MLKVVGASREQTRLTYTVLGIVIILAFGAAIFLDMPIKEEDGMYAATVTYSPRIGFHVEFLGQNNDPQKVPLGVARAYYKPDTHTTGWASIEIESSGDYPDWVQAYGAGLLEGSLCWQLIFWHWKNTVEASCESGEEECIGVRDYLNSVEEDAVKHAKKSENDEPFWHHVRLFYYQLDGLEEGFKMGVERSRKNKEISIEHEDFLWMNSINEIRDMKLNYEKTDPQITKQYTSLTFLKHLPNKEYKFLLAHETGRSYSEMLRMHKKYLFKFHETAEPESKPVTTPVTFTSYPGAIHSQDDYYQVFIDNGKHLTIAGSNMRISKSLALLSMEHHKVPIGPRAMAACRLSRSGEEWAKIVNHEGGSNMGGKQWMVLDSSPTNLTLWIIEQTPNRAVAVDWTKEFQEKGYCIAAGIPHFLKNPSDDSEVSKIDDRLLEALKMLDESQANVTSTETLYEVMHMPEIIALGRADIIQYKFRSLNPRHGGIIDFKVSDANGDRLAVAGPPYSDEVIPFQWSRSVLENIPHHGQPDRWAYPPVKPTWVW